MDVSQHPTVAPSRLRLNKKRWFGINARLNALTWYIDRTVGVFKLPCH